MVISEVRKLPYFAPLLRQYVSMNYFFRFLFLLFPVLSFSQCFQIESVLVDACGPDEGLNEMVRFRVGNTALNTSNLNVNWPNNDWEGLIQNTTTAAKVAALNADIISAGGCGQLLQPVNGVLPANAVVILVTSFNFDTALNQFGPITDTIYIVFQNNPATISGHFANSGTGLRTLQMFFGGCSDSVTYNRALLIDQNGVQTAGDGATVQFTSGGQATYTNNGCSAPVPPFTVEAGTSPINACAGTQISLTGSAQGQASVQWSAVSGTFSNNASLSTTYTIDPQASGMVPLTLTATNSCGASVSDTIMVTITPGLIPDFPTQLTLCQNDAVPVLAATSGNGISGTWNPATVDNQNSGTYTFTPTSGQCAATIVLSVTVNSLLLPDFETQLTLCQSATPPVLPLVSPNGISGTWNPAIIDNQAAATYIFTPDAGQCSAAVALSVTVSNEISPDFSRQLTICPGGTTPALATVSPNGISGSWNPAVIDNQNSGTYAFTPDPDQCASPVVLTVTVSNPVIGIDEFCDSGDYILQLTGEATSDDNAQIEWTDASGVVIGNSQTLNLNDLANGFPDSFPADYTVSVTLSSGCNLTKTVTVESIFCTIPKGISPNADGANDNFDLTGLSVSELKIFNRYGLEVFSKRNYTSEWHGQSKNGNDLPDGTYYYAVTTNEGKVRTGWVYVIRKA